MAQLLWRKGGSIIVAVDSMEPQEPQRKKVIDVSGMAIGLPIIGNENVYLETAGLIMCTGVVITNNENILLAHVVHDHENLQKTKDLIKKLLEKIENKSTNYNKEDIKLKAYYNYTSGRSGTDGELNAKNVVGMARELGLSNVHDFGISKSKLIIDVQGNIIDDISNYEKLNVSDEYESFIKHKTKLNLSMIFDKHDNAMKEFKEKLKLKDKMWIIKDSRVTRTEKLAYEAKLKKEPEAEEFSEEYKKLIGLRKADEQDTSTELSEKIKKENPIEDYMKEKMHLYNPWIVETAKSY